MGSFSLIDRVYVAVRDRLSLHYYVDPVCYRDGAASCWWLTSVLFRITELLSVKGSLSSCHKTSGRSPTSYTRVLVHI